MTTGKALNGKPYAGNPHVRFDEGEVASAAMPRRGSLLYKQRRINASILIGLMAGLVAGAASAATMTQLINGPSDIRVAPLVEASWAQGDVNGSPCYNSKTPHNYVCGCVATAAGEIMRRWQYPAAASVRRTNTCSTNGVQASFTMIGGPNVAYDWANMPFKPEGEASLSTAQREAIGTLLYDIGVAAGMDWTSNGSSTSTSIMVDQFTSVFGYSNAAIAGNPSGTGLSLEQFTQAVLPSLDAGMPVIVGIGGSNTQHSVVCDGYGYQDGDLYIHINMGSAIDSESPVGYNNTWYKFPTAVMNISTKEYTSGNGVSLWPNGEQSYLNPVVYNISPTMQKGWSIVSGRILSGETVVEGAEIVAVNASGEGVAKATSNAKGIYAIALPAGTYTLRAVDSDETKGARVSVTVVATAGTRDGATATGVVIGNQHGVDIALADIGRDGRFQRTRPRDGRICAGGRPNRLRPEEPAEGLEGEEEHRRQNADHRENKGRDGHCRVKLLIVEKVGKVDFTKELNRGGKR